MKPVLLLPVLFAASLFAGASSSNIAIDNAGNVWLTGTGITIATTPNAFQRSGDPSICAIEQLSPLVQPQSVPCTHAYVIKQGPSGNILYATSLGGSGQDGGVAITTDAQGNAYVTGYTYSADFPVTARAAQMKYAGPPTATAVQEGLGPFGPVVVQPGGDTFVTKFAPDGTLLYSTLLGGSGSDVPSSITVDTSGSVYIAGVTSSADFPVTPDGMSHESQSPSFFARLSVTATAWTYSTYSDPTIQSFDVDGQGDAFLTGVSQPPSGVSGPYVTAIATPTGQILYSTFLPTLNTALAGAGAAIAVSSSGTIFLGVSPAPVPAMLLTPAPPVYPLGASFFVELAAGGGSILTQTTIPSTQFDSVLLDTAGNAYTFGHGTGTLPSSQNPPLLAQPCTPKPGSFVIEFGPAGDVLAATYLRQGSDDGVGIGSPGHLSVYHGVSQATVALDFTKPPALNFGCLENLATGTVGAGLAAGEIFVTFGSGIGPARAATSVPDASGQYPVMLGGVEVFVDGIAAPLLFAQAGEIHGVIPFKASEAPTIMVRYNGQSAPALDPPGAFANPGIFVNNGQPAILNQDGTVNTPSNPARAGSIVSIYATGAGPFSIPFTDGLVTPIPPPFVVLETPPEVMIGGVQATVEWAGSAPGLIAGVVQINAQIPNVFSVQAPASRLSLILEAGGPQSPPVPISISP